MSFYGQRRHCVRALISKKGIEVDRAKLEVFEKQIPEPTVKGIRSFLGHAGFYRRFIKYFSKISKPLFLLLQHDQTFYFNKDCKIAFQILKKTLVTTPVIITLDWSKHFEVMCDASGRQLEQSQDKERKKILFYLLCQQHSQHYPNQLHNY